MAHDSRYSRHLLLRGFGEAAQSRLTAARVLVIGAGGLSSPMLMYLAAAGIGTIGIIDDDLVDESNLQRQVIFETADIGKSKALTAAARLKSMNPLITVVPYHQRIDSSNALDLIAGYDLVADGSDNFPTRYLVNDACLITGKPLAYGSVFRFEGQVSVFNYKTQSGEPGPDYRDLFPVPPPPETVMDCSEAGVLGVLPGIIGTMQALEVIKIISGIGEPLSGKLFHFDAMNMQSQLFGISKREGAPLITELIDYEHFCKGPEAANEAISEIDMESWTELRTSSAASSFILIDVREPAEYQQFNIGGQLIPIGELSDAVQQFDKDAKLIIHCKTGARATKAIRMMQKMGFTDLSLLKTDIS
ncbi:MAG: molybdopterin-synthase adenylyltransferase MoeB [Chitinophagaceae bacterium]|nr:MAG: molybdopterin-synthase adenylyltransferase MoeB [Chitinophagaceae bacterium]